MIFWKRFRDEKPREGAFVLVREKRKTGKMKYAYAVTSMTRPCLNRPDKYAEGYWEYESRPAFDHNCIITPNFEVEEDVEWADLGE